MSHHTEHTARSYKTYYGEKLESALAFQDFVLSTLHADGLTVVQFSSKKYQVEHGETSGGIEIKHDEMYKKTGNLYIEIAEKSHPNNSNYVLSGIYRADNSWLYAIGDYETFFIFAKSILKLLHKSKTHEYESKEIATSKGFLLPHKDAEKFAAKVYRMAL